MECPLCYDATALVKVKGCNHTFCASCAKEWFTRNDVVTCPMCRGPFVCREGREWIREKMERDTLFEDGVNIILNEPKVFRWIECNKYMWGVQISKIEKLKEFQIAYNAVGGAQCDWEDEDDFEEFVLNDDVSNVLKNDKVEYVDDPTNRWFTKYPAIV